MARMNSKIMLDYFPLDCHLDEKFELIEAEFGMEGFAVIIKLFQRIYGGCGYYCEWNGDTAMIFAKSVGLQNDLVKRIVSAAVQREIFSPKLFAEQQILTSKGIQERYFEAKLRCRRVDVRSDYLLTEKSSLPKNVFIDGINVYTNEQNDDNFQQTEKEKERERKTEKESERKTEKAKTSAQAPKAPAPAPTLEQIKAYARAKNLNSVNCDKFYSYYGGVGWHKISDWRAQLRYWDIKDQVRAPAPRYPSVDPREYDMERLEQLLQS